MVEYRGKIEKNSKRFWPINQGPRCVRIKKKIGLEDLVTHSLQLQTHSWYLVNEMHGFEYTVL